MKNSALIILATCLLLFSNISYAQWEKIAWDGVVIPPYFSCDNYLISGLNSHIYTSSDYGKNWVEFTDELPKGFDIRHRTWSDKKYLYKGDLSNDQYFSSDYYPGYDSIFGKVIFRGSPSKNIWEAILEPQYPDSTTSCEIISLSEDTILITAGRLFSGSNTIVAGTHLYKTTDRGKHWTDITSNFPYTLYNVHIKESDNILVSFPTFTRDSGVTKFYNGCYTSSDFGQSWHQAQGLPDSSDVSPLYSNGSIIAAQVLTHEFTLARNEGVFLSKNSGKSWTRINPTDFGDWDFDAYSNGFYPNLKYSGKYLITQMNVNDTSIHLPLGNNYFISKDTGLTWNKINVPGSIDSVISTAFWYKDRYLLYTYKDNQNLEIITYSLDSLLTSVSETQTGKVKAAVHDIQIASNNTVIATPYYNNTAPISNIIISNDYGLTWRETVVPDSGKVNNYGWYAYNDTIYVPGINKDKSGCIYSTTDGGLSWKESSPIVEGYYAHCVHVDDKYIFVETALSSPSNRDYYYYSSDRGLTWERAKSLLPMQQAYLRSVMLNGVIYAPTFWAPGIITSRDKGLTWEIEHPTLPSEGYYPESLEQFGSSVFVFGTRKLNNKIVDSAFVFVTNDDGKSWQAVDIGITNAKRIVSTTHDRTTIYCVLSNEGKFLDTLWLCLSNDTGKTWKKERIYFDPTSYGPVLSDSKYIYYVDDALYRLPKSKLGVNDNVKQIILAQASCTIVPNPASEIANITYYLPDRTGVSIVATNILGKRHTLYNAERMDSGEHTFRWDIHNIPEGMYLVTINIAGSNTSRLVSIIR